MRQNTYAHRNDESRYPTSNLVQPELLRNGRCRHRKRNAIRVIDRSQREQERAYPGATVVSHGFPRLIHGGLPLLPRSVRQ